MYRRCKRSGLVIKAEIKGGTLAEGDCCKVAILEACCKEDCGLNFNPNATKRRIKACVIASHSSVG